MPAARAQDNATVSPAKLKSMTVDELLQQDVLSVSRRPEPWALAPSNVFLISSRASSTIGALSLPDLLRLAPNLYVAQSSSYHWGVEARGFMRTNAHSNKLLVLVDGRSVYSPLFSNVFWDSTDVFIPDLDSIEVISGPSGSNWGSNAVNGVININSKSAHETVGGLFQMSAGSEGTQYAIRQGFNLGKTAAFRVYAKRTDYDATLSPAGSEDGYDDWHSTQVGFRADAGTEDTGALTFQGDVLIGRYAANPAPQVRNDTGNLILRYSRELSENSSFWIRAYHDYVMRDTNGALTETTRTTDVEFQYQSVLTSNQRLMWGANYRRIYDKAEESVGFVILPPRLWFNLGGAFVQHELEFADDRMQLTTGARLESNHFSGWEVQPNVRLAWHRPRQTAWVAVSRASRIPSRLDTGFFLPETPPYTVAGGPNFTSERLTAYELGWRGQPAKGLALTATVYCHDYDQLRTVEPTTPIVEANGGRGRSYGTELFMDYDVTPQWRLRAGGFVMRQENWLEPWSADLEGGVGEDSFPGYQAYLRNTFRLTRNVDLWLGLRRVGEVDAHEDGGGTVPAYTDLDACLRWRFRPRYELALAGRNLLDRSHPEIGGLAVRREVQRNVYATLRYEY
jgi:iron complex outermembrane receptor protein